MTQSFILLALTFSTLSAYLGFRAVRQPVQSKSAFVTLPSGKEQSSTQVNTFILYYIYVTWFAIIAYMVFDAGKIWTVIGTLHNLLEITLLIGLHSGGRITSVSFALWMFAYVILVILLSVYLTWPMDAIFFRWQGKYTSEICMNKLGMALELLVMISCSIFVTIGLCSDFALIFMFSRIYFATKEQLNQHGGPDKHDEELASGPKPVDEPQHTVNQPSQLQELRQKHQDFLARQHNVQGQLQQPHLQAQAQQQLQRELEELEQQLAELDDQILRLQYNQERRHQYRSSVITLAPASPVQFTNGHSTFKNPDGSPQPEKPVWAAVWRNPRQILLLVAASVAHLLGNCLTTLYPKSTLALASFLMSYALSYPAYAYYLYVDHHALRQTKIYLPDFSKVKNFTVACWSIFGSTAIIRLGLFLTTRDGNTGAL